MVVPPNSPASAHPTGTWAAGHSRPLASVMARPKEACACVAAVISEPVSLSCMCPFTTPAPADTASSTTNPVTASGVVVPRSPVITVWLRTGLVTPVLPKTANDAADPRFTGCSFGGGLAANTGQTANAAQRRNALSFFVESRLMARVPVIPPSFAPGERSNSLFILYPLNLQSSVLCALTYAFRYPKLKAQQNGSRLRLHGTIY